MNVIRLLMCFISVFVAFCEKAEADISANQSAESKIDFSNNLSVPDDQYMDKSLKNVTTKSRGDIGETMGVETNRDSDREESYGLENLFENQEDIAEKQDLTSKNSNTESPTDSNLNISGLDEENKDNSEDYSSDTKISKPEESEEDVPQPLTQEEKKNAEKNKKYLEKKLKKAEKELKSQQQQIEKTEKRIKKEKENLEKAKKNKSEKKEQSALKRLDDLENQLKKEQETFNSQQETVDKLKEQISEIEAKLKEAETAEKETKKGVMSKFREILSRKSKKKKNTETIAKEKVETSEDDSENTKSEVEGNENDLENTTTKTKKKGVMSKFKGMLSRKSKNNTEPDKSVSEIEEEYEDAEKEEMVDNASPQSERPPFGEIKSKDIPEQKIDEKEELPLQQRLKETTENAANKEITFDIKLSSFLSEDDEDEVSIPSVPTPNLALSSLETPQNQLVNNLLTTRNLVSQQNFNNQITPQIPQQVQTINYFDQNQQKLNNLQQNNAITANTATSMEMPSTTSVSNQQTIPLSGSTIQTPNILGIQNQSDFTQMTNNYGYNPSLNGMIKQNPIEQPLSYTSDQYQIYQQLFDNVNQINMQQNAVTDQLNQRMLALERYISSVSPANNMPQQQSINENLIDPRERNISDDEVTEEVIKYLRDLGILNETKLAQLNLRDFGTCMLCGNRKLVIKIGKEQHFGICKDCLSTTIANAKQGKFLGRENLYNQRYNDLHRHDIGYRESLNDRMFGGLGGNRYGANRNGSLEKSNERKSDEEILGSIASAALGSIIFKNADGSQKTDKLFLDANGNLVPIASLSGTMAPYGYVRDINGNLVPAKTLQEGLTAGNAVAQTQIGSAQGASNIGNNLAGSSGQITGSSTLLGGATGLGAGLAMNQQLQSSNSGLGLGNYNGVMNNGETSSNLVIDSSGTTNNMSTLKKAAIGVAAGGALALGTALAAKAINKWTNNKGTTNNENMVLNANGELVPKDSLNDPNAPYGYKKDENGNLVPATSEEEARNAVSNRMTEELRSTSNNMVLNANGELVPKDSLNDPNAPYGYKKDENGNLVPATSEEEARSAVSDKLTESIANVSQSLSDTKDKMQKLLKGTGIVAGTAATLGATVAAYKAIKKYRDDKKNDPEYQAKQQAKAEEKAAKKAEKEAKAAKEKAEKEAKRDKKKLDKAKKTLESIKKDIKKAEEKVTKLKKQVAEAKTDKKKQSANKKLDDAQDALEKLNKTLAAQQETVDKLEGKQTGKSQP